MSSFGYACYLFDTQKVACCLQFRRKGNWTIALRSVEGHSHFFFLQLDCNIYANACLQFTKKLSLFCTHLFSLFDHKTNWISPSKQRRSIKKNAVWLLKEVVYFCENRCTYKQKIHKITGWTLPQKNEQRKVKEHWAIAEELWQSYKYKLPENMLNSKLQYFPKKPPLYSRRKLNKQEAF